MPRMCSRSFPRRSEAKAEQADSVAAGRSALRPSKRLRASTLASARAAKAQPTKEAILLVTQRCDGARGVIARSESDCWSTKRTVTRICWWLPFMRGEGRRAAHGRRRTSAVWPPCDYGATRLQRFPQKMSKSSPTLLRPRHKMLFARAWSVGGCAVRVSRLHMRGSASTLSHSRALHTERAA